MGHVLVRLPLPSSSPTPKIAFHLSGPSHHHQYPKCAVPSTVLTIRTPRFDSWPVCRRSGSLRSWLRFPEFPHLPCTPGLSSFPNERREITPKIIDSLAWFVDTLIVDRCLVVINTLRAGSPFPCSPLASMSHTAETNPPGPPAPTETPLSSSNHPSPSSANAAPLDQLTLPNVDSTPPGRSTPATSTTTRGRTKDREPRPTSAAPLENDIFQVHEARLRHATTLVTFKWDVLSSEGTFRPIP